MNLSRTEPTEPTVAMTMEGVENGKVDPATTEREDQKSIKASTHPPTKGTSIRFYTVDKKIGSGNFANVFKGTHTITKDVVAIKAIDKEALTKVNAKENVLKLRREIEIMKKVVHRNIVRLYQVIEDKRYMYLVTEYASGGEIFDFIVTRGRLPEQEAGKKFHQLAIAVQHLHDMGIVHRDIKAENVLLDEQLNVKLADFGFSNHYDGKEKLKTWCGSPPYAAPELFSGTPYYGPEVDIWSLGVVLYVLVCGVLPFEGDNITQLKQRVMQGTFRIPYFMTMSCEQLVRSMLKRDPKKRPNIREVLMHEWMKPARESPDAADNGCANGNGQRPKYNSLIINYMVLDCKIIEDQLLDSLEKNKFDDHAGIYHILDDRIRLKQEKNRAQAPDVEEVSAAAAAAGPPNVTIPTHQPLVRRHAVAASHAANRGGVTHTHSLDQRSTLHQRLQQQAAAAASGIPGPGMHRNGMVVTATLSSPAQGAPITAHPPVGRNISQELASRDTLHAYLAQRRHTLAPQGIQQALASQASALQGSAAPHLALGAVATPVTMAPLLAANLTQQQQQSAAPPTNLVQAHIHRTPRGLHPQVRQKLSGGPAVLPVSHVRPPLGRRRSDTHALQDYAMSQQQHRHDTLETGSGHLQASSGSFGPLTLHGAEMFNQSNVSVLAQEIDNLHVQGDGSSEASQQYQPQSSGGGGGGSSGNNHRAPPQLYVAGAGRHHVSQLQTIQSPSPEDSTDMASHMPLHATESSPAAQTFHLPPAGYQHEAISRLVSAPDPGMTTSSSAHGPLGIFPNAAAAALRENHQAHLSPDMMGRAMPNHQLRRNSLDPRVTLPGAHMAVANAAGGVFHQRHRSGRRSSHAQSAGIGPMAINMLSAQQVQTLAAVPNVVGVDTSSAAAAAGEGCSLGDVVDPTDAAAAAAGDDARAPREARFAMSPMLISSLPIQAVLQEICRVLDQYPCLKYEQTDYVFTVSVFDSGQAAAVVQFDIEICQLPGLRNMLSLRFQRLAGDQWSYKAYTNELMQQLRLK
eukprot:scpid68531/ scgid13168/ Serine/threonine-protein kinase SIK3; Salt-inducible kinase 3; Serine/threonine-protein kinase QSK